MPLILIAVKAVVVVLRIDKEGVSNHVDGEGACGKRLHLPCVLAPFELDQALDSCRVEDLDVLVGQVGHHLLEAAPHPREKVDMVLDLEHPLAPFSCPFLQRLLHGGLVRVSQVCQI